MWFGQEEADFEKLSEMGENVTTAAPRQNRWFGSLPISVGPLSHTGFAKTDQNQTFISASQPVDFGSRSRAPGVKD